MNCSLYGIYAFIYIFLITEYTDLIIVFLIVLFVLYNVIINVKM